MPLYVVVAEGNNGALSTLGSNTEAVMPEELIGTVDHYFAHIGVAGVALVAPLKIGDKIRIKGHTTDFEENVDSIQIEHQSVGEALLGTAVGLKVRERVRHGDEVYKLS